MVKNAPSGGGDMLNDILIVRSSTTRHTIPSLLTQVDFRGAVVADIGCGYGTKGLYAIRHGASYAVLIDVDGRVIRRISNGVAMDRVVADARLLPLRDSSIDIAIFWNVVNFIKEKDQAINEVKRVCRGITLFSTYNAMRAYWHYDEWSFAREVMRMGRPITTKKVSNKQFQAIVVVNHD